MTKLISTLLPYKQRLLVWSIGIVYLWFGTLKFIPGASPAEALAKATLDKLTFGLVPSPVSYFFLALWEVVLGLCLLIPVRRPVVIAFALIHILFTFTPLVLLPGASFQEHTFSLTLVGQYIIKNLIIFSALLYVYPAFSKSKSQVLAGA